MIVKDTPVAKLAVLAQFHPACADAAQRDATARAVLPVHGDCIGHGELL